MADYVTREMARDRLRKACKMGGIVSVVLLIAGLCFAGIAAVIGLGVKLPNFVSKVLYVLVPNMDDSTLALAECAAKALLLILSGIIGMLMFRKVNRTGDAFRAGQLRQFKFMALLMTLLGFLPTIAGNCAKVAVSASQGGSLLQPMSFYAEPMCIIAGLTMFMAARMLVAGSVLTVQEGELIAQDPVAAAPEPDFVDVPDLANVPTAAPLMNNHDTVSVDDTEPQSPSVPEI